MSTLNIQLLCRGSIDFPELAIFASGPGAMITLDWLEQPMARTIFHGPKGVRAIEVRLYTNTEFCRAYSFTLRKHAYPNILEILPPKNENFQIKYSDILHSFAQNIDCGYALEPPRDVGFTYLI